MALSDKDVETLAALIDENGYTVILDAMADNAQAAILTQGYEGACDAISAITADLQRTFQALEHAACDVRG